MSGEPRGVSGGRRKRDTRPGPAARRFGYVVAIAVNVLFLYLIHGRPGWDAVSILSEETTRVLPFVDASIVASIAVNVFFLVRDSRAVKALGDLVTTAFSLAAMIRIWQVWPFDFAGAWGGWRWLIETGMVVGTFGVGVGLLVALTVLVRQLSGMGPTPGGGRA